MCGIAGILEFGRDARADAAALRAMCQIMAHRGPDDDGFYIDGRVGIGMRRLSIVDLATGHQPISNEDGSITIVFNGEIYNHLVLREQLIARGHSYRTHSDTETIVHLYEEYGRDCVKHLRGMFAFAIWDRNKKTLFIARDRLGIKPLYYRLTPERLLFGSEIKVVLAHGSDQRGVQPRSPAGISGLRISLRRRHFLLGNPQTAARPHDGDRSRRASHRSSSTGIWMRRRRTRHATKAITFAAIANCSKARSAAI